MQASCTLFFYIVYCPTKPIQSEVIRRHNIKQNCLSGNQQNLDFQTQLSPSQNSKFPTMEQKLFFHKLKAPYVEVPTLHAAHFTDE